MTVAVPAVPMSAAGMAAWTSVLDRKPVVRSEPFHRTFEPETKLLPSTVSVKDGPPAVAQEGVRLTRAG